MSRNYKFHNQVEEGLVFRSEDYLYSSAADYAGEKGLLDNVIVVKQCYTKPRDTNARERK